MATTLYLVRHAQANPLPAVPEPEWELSERGRAQAAELVPVRPASRGFQISNFRFQMAEPRSGAAEG